MRNTDTYVTWTFCVCLILSLQVWSNLPSLGSPPNILNYSWVGQKFGKIASFWTSHLSLNFEFLVHLHTGIVWIHKCMGLLRLWKHTETLARNLKLGRIRKLRKSITCTALQAMRARQVCFSFVLPLVHEHNPDPKESRITDKSWTNARSTILQHTYLELTSSHWPLQQITHYAYWTKINHRPIFYSVFLFCIGSENELIF